MEDDKMLKFIGWATGIVILLGLVLFIFKT